MFNQELLCFQPSPFSFTFPLFVWEECNISFALLEAVHSQREGICSPNPFAGAAVSVNVSGTSLQTVQTQTVLSDAQPIK